MTSLVLVILAFLVITCIFNGKVTAQPCFTSADDCFSGGTDPALTTYEACCQPLLDDNTVRRSFVSNGRCFECILIGLDQPMYTLNESNTVYTRRLRLLAPTGYTGFARPRLRLNGFPGTSGVNDFSLVTSDIFLREPVVGIDVAITISVDGIAGEPPEMFTITSQPPGVSGNADPLFLFRNTTVTIIDTDKPIYQFDEVDYAESEGTGLPIVVNVQQIVPSEQDVHLLLVPLTYDQYSARAATDPTLAAIEVYHGGRPDPAEHNVRQDFDRTVRRVFFPANSGNMASQRVSIPILDDAIDEEPEGFIIVLYRDDNLTFIEVAFTPNLRTTLGKINDDDPFYFGFVLNEFTYNEAHDEGIQEIRYSPAPGNLTEKLFAFSLNLNTLVGDFVFGARQHNGDISFGAGVIRPTFTFHPNVHAPEDRIVTFSVCRDNVIEGQEIGQLQIAPSTSFDGFTPLFQNVRITINDSTTAVFNLSAPPVVYEQNITFLAMISLIAPSGGTTFQIEIDAMELGITATPVDDFWRSAPSSFIFQGTERPGCCEELVPYQVWDDNVAEPNEILTISIARSISSASIPVEFEVQRVNVTIIDNDMARIGFENIKFLVQEGAGFAELPVTVLGTTTLGREVTVRFNTSDLSAKVGSDYTSTVMELVFSAAVRRHVVRVPITHDSFSEFINEQFRASLSLVDDNGINVIVDPDLAAVTIVDDNVIVFGFARDVVTVNEADGSAILTVRVLMGVLAPGATVLMEFTTADGPVSNTSAIAPADYASVTRQLSFNSAATEFNVSVPIINDNLIEQVESFLANLRLISAVGIVNIVPSQATVSIQSDDRITVGFRASVDVLESVGNAMLVAQVTGGQLDHSVTLQFNTADGSALAGSDYTSTVTELTFSSNVRRIVVRIPVLQDSVIEVTEQFRASLSLVQSNGINVDISPDQATVDIIDDDELWIGFTQHGYSGLEGDFVLPVVKILSGGIAPGVSVAVRFQTANIQATAPSDFKQTDHILKFNSNNTSITVPVSLQSDSVYERSEVFDSRLRLQPTIFIVYMNPNRAQLTIIDNSNVILGFRVADIQVSENVGNAMLIVEVKKGQLRRIISLQYSTLDRAGTDYSTTSGTITFTPTNTQQTISIPIIDDMVRENRETLTVRLTNAPARVSLAPDKAWISIVDNDSVLIGFDPKRGVYSEESGRGHFTVRVISGRLDSSTSVAVLLNTASCTADSGIDFSPLQDVRLIFNSTHHSITVPLIIVNDDLVENDEALMASIRLAVPVPRVSLAPDEAELTITDTVDRAG